MLNGLSAAVLVLTFLTPAPAGTDSSPELKIVPIAEGWAENSINAVIFRRNSIATHGQTQYAAFYDADSKVVLARRALGSSDWEMRKTRYKGNTRDAHNAISIIVDSTGVLHMSWDHHCNALNYCRSKEPGSLELTDRLPMTGLKENKVTYPEFYNLPCGGLLFVYRDGASGRGDLMMNRYDPAAGRWTQLQDSLINGEGERNAYWQTAIGPDGSIHLSWVWRETGDVATNHDLCYAASIDGGKSWRKSTGEPYELPITAQSAECACAIPQKSELINTTSMCLDSEGRPYIATYWRPAGTDVPQYHLVHHDGKEWKTSQIARRTEPFSLSGFGTRRIPISRPQIVADSSGSAIRAYMVFRDAERQSRVSIAACDDLGKGAWRINDLTDGSVGLWEPSYDTALWQRDRTLHLFVQKVGQGQGEKLEKIPPQMVSILEWTPGAARKGDEVREDSTHPAGGDDR